MGKEQPSIDTKVAIITIIILVALLIIMLVVFK